MAITTYNELVTAIANWLDDTTLTARIPEFIALAETQINDDLRIRSMEKRATSTLTTADRYQTLPTKFAQAKRLWLMTTPITEMLYVPPSRLIEFYASSSGKPIFYTVSGNEFEMNRKSDSAYTMETLFWQKVTPISASNATNSVITEYPNIYLYASLVAAGGYLVDDERIPLWKSLYDEGVRKANMAANRSGLTTGSRYIASAGRP